MIPNSDSNRWIQAITDSHTELKSKYYRMCDHQRATREDQKLIQEWFDRVARTVQQYDNAFQPQWKLNKLLGPQKRPHKVAELQLHTRGNQSIISRSNTQPSKRNWASFESTGQRMPNGYAKCSYLSWRKGINESGEQQTNEEESNYSIVCRYRGCFDCWVRHESL